MANPYLEGQKDGFLLAQKQQREKFVVGFGSLGVGLLTTGTAIALGTSKQSWKDTSYVLIGTGAGLTIGALIVGLFINSGLREYEVNLTDEAKLKAAVESENSAFMQAHWWGLGISALAGTVGAIQMVNNSNDFYGPLLFGLGVGGVLEATAYLIFKPSLIYDKALKNYQKNRKASLEPPKSKISLAIAPMPGGVSGGLAWNF